MSIHIISYILFVALLILMIIFTMFKVKVNKLSFLVTGTVMLILLLIIAYTYQPLQSSDLSRYFVYMNNMRGHTWEVVRENGAYNETILINYLMYLVSQTNNLALLSLVTAGIFFSAIYIQGYKMIFIDDIFENNGMYNLYFFMIISVLSLPLIMSGVRQNLAWVFMMLAIYYDYFNKSKKMTVVVLLYLLPLTIHVSAVMIPIIKLFTIIINRRRKLVLIVLSWPLLMNLVSLFEEKLPSILQIAYRKYNMYINYKSTPDLRAFVNFSIYILLFFLAIVLYQKNLERTNKEFIFFYLTLIIFGLATLDNTVLSKRLLDLIILISLPVLAQIPNLSKLIDEFFIYSLLFSTGLLFIYQDIAGLYHRIMANL